MWRTLAAVALGAVALWGQAPIGPTQQTPPRDPSTRPARPSPAANVEAATAAIRGRVVGDGSEVSVAIAKARVALNGGVDQIEPVFTDSSGRFEFSGLAAGHYTLSAEKTGYAPTHYGARSRFDPVQPIELTAGALEDIEIRMPKGAAISGRILDEVGDPVVGAHVSASVLRVEGTSRRLENVSRAPADTDDLGDYRIGGLPAGRYLLSVSGGPAGSVALSMASFGRRVGWGRTFYPSGASSAVATPIELTAGEERAGTDLTLVPFKPAELSVTITTTTPDPPMPATPAEAVRMGIDPRMLQMQAGTSLLFVQADEPDTAAASNQRLGFMAAGGGGSWAAPTVSIDPGEWVVIARRGNTAGLAHIALASGDVATLSLPLAPGARFSGQILFEGPTRHPLPSSVHLDVIGAGPDANLSPQTLAPGGPFTPKADGAFEITGVIGTIEILVADPVGWAVKSIMTGERDILGVPISLLGTEAFTDVKVVLTDQVAELSGSLVSADSQETSDCSIALFPSAPNAGYTARRMQLARPNQHGEFRFDDLPSGTYLVAARPDINAGAWTTPASLDRLHAGATPFTIADREKKTITLPCVGTR